MSVAFARVAVKSQGLEVRLHERVAPADRLGNWQVFVDRHSPTRPLSLDPRWAGVLADGLGHEAFMLEAVRGEQVCGLLSLAYVKSFLFGRFLVSLPYLNYGGVLAESDAVADELVQQAVQLADRLSVRYLELRQVEPVSHAALGATRTDKVNMRLRLPDKADKLWSKLSAKVRNQVRKAEKSDLTVVWGGLERLGDFYRVFSENMRDLGTPVYGRRLFRAMLEAFPGSAEICMVRAGQAPVAAGVVMHGSGISEVPSASSLRAFNPTCANMLLYWHMLQRAIARGQEVFDFGRSSRDSATFKFKKQWGAQPLETVWQYYVRRGEVGEARRDNPRFAMMIRMWQRLPLFLTRWLGPAIVRGIPS